MKTLRIDSTDIFLDDKGEGKGKITISDMWMGAYNCYWGAMGGSLEEFLLGINSSYFVDKLCRSQWVFDGKLSAKNIRKHIREELAHKLPYWKFMSAQKELREKIKELESCSNQNEFVDACKRIPDDLMCYDLSREEEREFKDIIRDIFTNEPWNFIEEVESREAKWLAGLHVKLQGELRGSI